MDTKKLVGIIIFSSLLIGCAKESSQTIVSPTVNSYNSQYNGVKTSIAVGKFENRSNYQNGIFSDGVDRLGNQSKTLLISHLQQTNHFNVLDRTNMGELAAEANYKKQKQNIIGANYIISGDITEFGRKEVGDHQLWGILGKGKQQIAYAKVNLNIIDINTSQVVYSVQGAGEYSLSNREVIGFGGTASYDSTLNGKVLDLAIREAINNLVNGLNNGAWKPATK
ncbi:CsgG/HfaB family protein [Gilliamella sp. B14448G11]|uniref:CsgG/HfaB family protein n=1 Tax=unclassified Gilliamella TaxID=2685620 RepID=UPI0018DB0623|nr:MULTISPECIES: CsgG/HfaB family protein [unclassified Gilliamella]MBI0027200.1 CsgG/HfaB family protein [Gilliamella sp. B14448G7]MBI0029784.1 CsgG/HfaB family protein [Gilliamella sp. B14384G15]MBI0034159.1 CsgG/HfaB family protein [Gilliamella sp. B14448G11]MBI0041894.1 CsgG/HfaB family protein [Gilliamella sp. B14448G12]MBI0057563.1 CsgG/HfaB family protein [Gilliamella sp. B14384G12]